MFERRLKIVLIVMFVAAFLLFARSMHLQVVQRGRWTKLAADAMVMPRLLETTRGKIVDRKNRTLAQDDGCIDACIDYRVLKQEPDEEWLRKFAIRRLQDREPDAYKAAKGADREAMRKKEIEVVKEQIKRMWGDLARTTGKSEDEINRIRGDIESRVTLRKRLIWWRRYAKAMNQFDAKEKPPWYKAFVLGENTSAPQIDVFEQTIAEELSRHVVVRAIDPAAYNTLAKNLDRYPGMELRGSNHRIYPYGDVASHVIGNLGKVTREDLANAEDDVTIDEPDRREYQLNDLIGRGGLEALLEPTLRGTRGKELYNPANDQVVKSWPTIPGQDVKCTIDIELQQSIQELFHHAQIPGPKNADPPVLVDMHGAAVVLDLASNEVLALVSNPTYDLNALDENYPKLIKDIFNAPLLQRATQAQLEPGSTVKPIVGLSAITAGALGLHEGIECTGSPVLHGLRWNYNRCWTVSKVPLGDEAAIHHRIPWESPHRGQFGNPDGFLIFSDALCRSCNVFFVNCADRLGIDGLSEWMNRFGLGRPTGIGITESRGRLPRDYDGPRKEMTTWSAGIGQGYVSASPLQMANIAATIARGGVWMRPKLVDDGVRVHPWKPHNAGPSWSNIPNRIDLQLNPDAVREAQHGMMMVTNDPAGTGRQLSREQVHNLFVAGKTGTAQAAPFRTPASDAEGRPLKDADGQTIWVVHKPSLYGSENPLLPWYRGFDDGENLKHAWFIGFVPADHPKLAFAVMVEYGGSGGAVAGPIARGVLEALVNHGYLPAETAAVQN